MTGSVHAAPIHGGHAYSLYFVVAAFICLGLALLPIVVHRGQTFERRCYWGGTFGAAVSALIAGISDWIGGLSFACVTVFAMWLPAYFGSGELIKIRGKVYSFHIRRSAKSQSDRSAMPNQDVAEEYPDAYGANVTAAKLWSLLIVVVVFLMGGFAIGLTDPDGRSMLVMSAIAFVVSAIGFGYFADGSYGYPVARRQYVQFVLVTLMSAGTFALLYLPAYFLGRRWPFRHSQSLEREAQPRYWEK